MPSATETVAPALNATSRANSTRSRAAPKRITVVEISQSNSKSARLRVKDSTKVSAAAKKASKIEAPASKTTALKMATKRKATELQSETTRKKAKTTTAKPVTAKVPASKRVANAKPSVQKIRTVKPTVAKKPTKVEKTENESVKTQKKVSSKPIASTRFVPKKVVKSPQIINITPSQRLDIYVFGEGSAGELGLGAEKSDGKSPVDVKRPRLNQRLSSKDVGVVNLAVGGMHCAALTYDNKILTWGVNDQGALGRETAQGGKMKDLTENVDSGSDSDSDDSDDSGLNPNEAEPREIDWSGIEEGTKFVAVFAGDSTTFALTTDGRVYGWGTFRGNDGVLGFRHDTKTQYKPMLIPELKNIVNIACGTNHVLALDTKGKVFTWGAGEQNQLARRVVSRTAMGALVPREFGLGRKRITHIGCGDYHSFAISSDGDVYSWGLNTFGQTGVPKDGLDEEDENTVQLPTIVESLREFDIKQITGGAHHTLACTETGQVLIWGRIDNNQGGIPIEEIPQDNIFFDENNRPRYLIKPTQIPNINGSWVATGNDTCIVVDTEGKAYSWGFSINYQTGQGTEDDIVEATQIDNTAVRGQNLIFAGVGGQFGVLGGCAL